MDQERFGEVRRSGLGSLITKSPEAIEISTLDAVEIVVEPFAWVFAQARRADIDRHFAAQQRERPALWNGRVLLLHRYAQENRVLRGASFETDYASFLAWREWGFPAAGVFNVFAAAALRIGRRRLSARSNGAVHRGGRAMGFSMRHARARRYQLSRHARPHRQSSVANCSRRLASTSLLAKSSQAGRWCAMAGSSR